MATQAAILVWRIPWVEEPGGLQFMGSQTVNMIEQLTHVHVPLFIILLQGCSFIHIFYFGNVIYPITIWYSFKILE